MENSIRTKFLDKNPAHGLIIASIAVFAVAGMMMSGSAFGQMISPTVHHEEPNPALVKPSFGGVPLHKFNDGLKITTNGQTNTFDLSGYSATIPQQKFEVGQPATFTIKWQPDYGSYAWKHIAIFYNFGEGGSLPSESDSAMSIDNVGGKAVVTMQDPHHFLTDVKVGNIYDASTVYSNFQFTPTKYMPDSAMFIQAWDNQQRVSSIYVAGAMQFGEPNDTSSVPVDPNLAKFDSFGNFINYIKAHGYDAPKLASRIHSSKDVFMGGTGDVYWTVNTKTNIATVNGEQDGKLLFTQSETLSNAQASIPSIDGW